MSAVLADDELIEVHPSHQQPHRLGVSPGSRLFLDRDQVNATTWYHVTNSAQWHQRVLDAGIHVHLGTYESAMARCSDVEDVYPEVYLFEIRLLNAELDPRIYRDVPFDQQHPLPHTRYDGYRYLNEYEHPGSISLFIHADAFEVLGVEKL